MPKSLQTASAHGLCEGCSGHDVSPNTANPLPEPKVKLTSASDHGRVCRALSQGTRKVCWQWKCTLGSPSALLALLKLHQLLGNIKNQEIRAGRPILVFNFRMRQYTIGAGQCQCSVEQGKSTSLHALRRVQVAAGARCLCKSPLAAVFPGPTAPSCCTCPGNVEHSGTPAGENLSITADLAHAELPGLWWLHWRSAALDAPAPCHRPAAPRGRLLPS